MQSFEDEHGKCMNIKSVLTKMPVFDVDGISTTMVQRQLEDYA